MINEDKYIDFVIENKLTQKQFLLLHLVYKKRYDLLKKYKDAFPTGDGSIIGRLETEDLIDRGLLIIGEGHKPVISKKFKDAYTDDVLIAEEIFSVYPDFYESEGGVKYPLLAMDRLQFSKIYLSKIKYSQKEHEEILEDILYGIENNLIKIKLANFLASEYWKIIRKIRLGEEQLETDNIIGDAPDFG